MSETKSKANINFQPKTGLKVSFKWTLDDRLEIENTITGIGNMPITIDNEAALNLLLWLSIQMDEPHFDGRILELHNQKNEERKAALLLKLKLCAQMTSDKEAAHLNADEDLLKFIDDPDVTKAFKSIKKWYA